MDQLHRLRDALASRYRLDSEIGHGGMAVVYHARDLQHGRDVAIKVVRPELAVGLGTERFLREIHIAAALQHPHILPVHDSGSADGLLYYVMPYVAGESLCDRLQRERQLPLNDALRIAYEVADALSYAHSHGVVHRDIKPGNIMLSGYPPASNADGWHAVVADFGLARAVLAAGGERLTGTGVVVGTPEYMSPEQASGDETLDGRSDVYSLACVLYEMLSGEPPFTGRTAQIVVARHCQDAPPSIRVVRPNLPLGIEEVLKTALAKVPADRYATAHAFGERVDPAVWREQPGKPATRWGPRVVGSAVALLMVLAAAALAAKLRHGASEPAMPGVGVMVLPFQLLGAPAVTPTPHLLFTGALDWIPGVHGIDGASLAPASRDVPAKPFGDLLQGARRAGAKYLVTGAILGGGSKVSVDLYSTGTGERIAHYADTAAGPRLDGAIGRLALQSIEAFARQEGLDLGGRRAVLGSTASIAAAGHLLRGQTKFWQDDYAAAADEFRAAIAADSGCGLAYQRLGVAETWQNDYPAALAALDAGLARRDRLEPRWVNLLKGQRYYVLGWGDSAIAAFQGTVLDDRTEVDGWLGLGESLVHFAGFTGHSAMDARPALERVVSLDSTFAPIYDDLVQLAVYAGDERVARTYLARLSPDSPLKAGTAAIVSLRFGSPQERRAALAQLRSADRQVLREAIIFWMHGGFDLGLADSAAGYLMGSDRTPDDRRRGAQYRLIARIGQGQVPEALRAWSSTAGAYPFDPWMVQAYLAGYPVREVAEPMFAWARARLAQGGALDLNRPPWDEVRQGFEALVHRASLEGDSAEVLDLLRRIKRAPSPDPTEPSPGALRASLEGRLSLLAGDTVAAIGALRRSVSRIAEIYTANHPLMAMAPQRLLLSELAAKRGDSVETGRWRDSFSNSWSIADVLYLARLGRLRPRP
jgi:tetratricopeptide (TPR) repeat protein